MNENAPTEPITLDVPTPIVVRHGKDKDTAMYGPSPLIMAAYLPGAFPKTVYNYASMIHDSLENPRQHTLDHDVIDLLGSSDPPAGFGFQHPRFYNLQQRQPRPLEPLRVWRGYNGHVYFAPIRVQQIGNDSISSPMKSPQPSPTPYAPATLSEPPRQTSNLSANERKPLNQRNNTDRSIERKRSQRPTTASAPLAIEKSQLTTRRSAAATDGKESEQTQLNIEHVSVYRDDQSSASSAGHHRAILPHLRPISPSKVLRRGLACKHPRRPPHAADSEASSLEKPLIERNLSREYARNEQSPPQPSLATLREIRKRIVRGTTRAYRPSTQSDACAQGRMDPRSISVSNILVPVRGRSTFEQTSPPPSMISSQHEQRTTAGSMRTLTAHLKIPPTEYHANSISSL